jgi:hypothetical protein
MLEKTVWYDELEHSCQTFVPLFRYDGMNVLETSCWKLSLTLFQRSRDHLLRFEART